MSCFLFHVYIELFTGSDGLMDKVTEKSREMSPEIKGNIVNRGPIVHSYLYGTISPSVKMDRKFNPCSGI